MSRIANTLKNTASGTVLRIVTLILHFATRTLFVRFLGNEFLSVNGLVSSVLSFLNITELGIGSALVYAMYKPIAEQNQEKVRQYVQYYKKIYSILGFTVLALGTILFPIYLYLVEDASGHVNVVMIFLIQLASSFCSYFFFINRGGFLNACQEEYRLTLSNVITMTVTTVGQIVSIAVLKNYYLYILVPVVTMVVQKIVNGILIGRWHPYIKEKPQGTLEKSEIKALFQNTYGLAISKICTIMNSAADNMIISGVIGLAVVGHYSNYQTLLTMLSSTVGIVFSAVLPSVGNLNAIGTVQEKKRVFNNIKFISFWIYGFSTIAYVVIVQPFVSLWIGSQYLMPISSVIVFGVNFLTAGLNSPVNTFREGGGLYYEGRYKPVFVVVVNVIFSIILGKWIGVVGIILATIISRMTVTWWFDAYLVFNHIFEEGSIKYLIEYLLKFVLIAIVGVITYFACSFIPFSSVVAQIVCRAIACLVIINGLFYLIYGRTEEFKYFASLIKSLLNKILRRKTNV